MSETIEERISDLRRKIANGRINSPLNEALRLLDLSKSEIDSLNMAPYAEAIALSQEIESFLRRVRQLM